MTAKQKEEYMQNLVHLLNDSIRSRIYFEALVEEEITAQKLMKQLSIHRSTLTHHLTKFVEAGIFSVRVQETGRPIKYYKLRKLEKIIIKKDKEHSDLKGQLEFKIEFLESTAAHLQVISNLSKETAIDISSDLEKGMAVTQPDQTPDKTSEYYSFSFNLLTEEQAKLWNKKYHEKMMELDKELQEIKRNTSDDKPKVIYFFGTIPIVRKD